MADTNEGSRESSSLDAGLLSDKELEQLRRALLRSVARDPYNDYEDDDFYYFSEGLDDEDVLGSEPAAPPPARKPSRTKATFRRAHGR